MADPVPAFVLEELHRDESVHMVGSQVDVVPYYAAMDVFTLPSYREGFPNVVIEAGAMKLPTVAFDVSGCSDAVVSGETGSLVERGDSSLAAAVVELLEKSDLRVRMGRQAYWHVAARYNPREIWSHLVTEYRRFLPPRRGDTAAQLDPSIESRQTSAARADL
jgi:glycosyltransferase involved in cell wall biosynthesis